MNINELNERALHYKPTEEDVESYRLLMKQVDEEIHQDSYDRTPGNGYLEYRYTI